MTTELLGLPGAGKTYYSQQSQHYGYAKRAVAAHISTHCLNNRLLSFGLKSARVSSALGLERQAVIELARKDADIRKQAGESVKRIAFAADMASFLSDDFHEMIDSLYREIVLGRYCQREGLKLVNDDGAVQRILSLIGLRAPEADMAARQNACAVIAAELGYVEEVNILRVDPDFAYERCLNRRGGLPGLMKHLPEEDIRQRFAFAATVIDMIADTLAQNDITVRYFDCVDGDWLARAATIPQTESK